MSFENESTTITSAISELLATGRTEFSVDKVRYVCHTSTIPLATTVDEQYILKDRDDCVELKHSVRYKKEWQDDIIRYKCCKKHCMYIGESKRSTGEILRGNCPCDDVVRIEYSADEEIEVHLQPLCFLQVIKELRYNFGYMDESQCESDPECCHNDAEIPKSNRPRIDFDEIMFCQNSQSILDSGYSAPLRSIVGFSGWENCTNPSRLSDLLCTLYWFRKHSRNNFLKFLETAVKASGFQKVKLSIAQALHTLNGMICKKLLLFPCEMEDYLLLSKNTSQLFEFIVRDYLKPIDSDIVASSETSLFLKMKETFKNVKERFASETYEMRMSCFDLTVKEKSRCAFERFWWRAFSRLRRRIEALDSDYTRSIAWITTMSGFSQTRNMGYLPPWVAHQKRKQFRETIGRDTEKIPKEELLLVRKLIHVRCSEAGIERNLLDHRREHSDRFKEVINSIALPLKVSASENSTVRQGGKVEDARQLISDGIRNRWKVPIRDLTDGEIKEFLEYKEELRGEQPAYEGYLFWTALQIVLNNLSKRYRKYIPFTHELTNSEEWEKRIFQMVIVHISEPGKERNLTKTSSLLAWVLTVASKVSQTALSYNQDHRSGLILSAQDWIHQRRISSESYESYFIYDETTRKRNPDVINGYQDWTESTDFIPRQVGGVAIQSWFEWLDFPRWYGDLIVTLTQHNYTVSEVTSENWIDGILEKTLYTGKVSEGFMMSMPLTKTILHLMHDVNIGLADALVRRLIGSNVVTSNQVLERYRPELHSQPQRSDMRIVPQDTK